MSLINDALKKAQKQRTGESPSLASMPSVGGEPAARIAKRAKPVGFNSLLIRVGAGAVALIAVIATGWVFLRSKSVPTTAPQSPTVAQAKPAATTPATSSPPPAAVPATTPAFTLQVAPKPEVIAPKPETVQVAVTKPAVPQPAAQPPATATSTKTPTVPTAPAAPLKLEPREINFIENIRVAGIRASTTDSKVLMNDRVYRIGDTVEHEMGLKLTGITANSLTFEDERGARYTRTF